MGKKLKRKKAAFNAKAIEKRLQHYGKGDARDKFGKPTNIPVIAKAKPLTELSGNDSTS